MEFFDEQGKPAATVSFDTLKALGPLTVNPSETLKKFGLDDAALEAALTEIARIAASR
ncbi:hypothetical protein [Pseudomonas sp. Xaverov 259]|uniref:hypothetical protein n=1 Tax=Pseudomonas sp. Xaverov 259 TaxID=2666086 RepID=UPI001C5BA773|nr:hypothetical protein [Pseudomonas sp. Xaverov 259]